MLNILQQTNTINKFHNLHGLNLELAIHLFKTEKFLWIITEDMNKAETLQQELMFLDTNAQIYHLADWETLPYDSFSPNKDIVSERISTLNALLNAKTGILITPVNNALQKLSPIEFIQTHAFKLKIGDNITISELINKFVLSSYEPVRTVFSIGQFAHRGSIVDVFPMGCKHPYRIDFFGDHIDSIRTFDLDSQISIDKVSDISLFPTHEFPFDEQSIKLFKQNFYEYFDGNTNSHIYEEISKIKNGHYLPLDGIEYYLPLFFTKTATLFDYIPAHTHIILIDNIKESISNFLTLVQDRYIQKQQDMLYKPIKPNKLWLHEHELLEFISKYKYFELFHNRTDRHGFKSTNTQELPDFKNNPLTSIKEFRNKFTGNILFVVNSISRIQVLKKLLDKIDIQAAEINSFTHFLQQTQSKNNQNYICVFEIDQGMTSKSIVIDNVEYSFAIIPENLLFSTQKTQYRKKIKTLYSKNSIKSLLEIEIGDIVVHLYHGIGRYLGLQSIEYENVKNELIVLEYAENSKLYVSVTDINLISRYSNASGTEPKLSNLGSDVWNKVKQKALSKIRDTATHLLEIYATRESLSRSTQNVQQKLKNPILPNEYEKFVQGFGFEPTQDQTAAIDSILNDFTQNKPMDRLICGDVGFGKTEVAMRAAFIAIYGICYEDNFQQISGQVAILAPTTLLAQQHYNNFVDRFANFPVNVEVLSRFISTKEIKQALQRTALGQADIIIGTHRLLQKDVQFKNLKLVIIDEEHRFGVRQKEEFKKLRHNVNVLSLTATPIPRTLNLALSGLRDLSIITTPPLNRLSINTFVIKKNNNIIKDAIMRELYRGGQIYYVHNHIKSIELAARELQELVPEALISYAHGQMGESDLERVMNDFYHRRFNILVATNIIETGIDIPSTNTIIIEDAHKLGLAQLHQLRGRVGRSYHQAYAYLLIPDAKLSDDANKRLQAIVRTKLGEGFNLAREDLEIRGAGELLGDDQSGQINSIGFTLYTEMLEKAINTLKQYAHTENGTTIVPKEQIDNIIRNTEIDLQIPALIDEHYMPDINLRLSFYRQIANSTQTSIARLQFEMQDRFGTLTDNTLNLFKIQKLRLQAQDLGAKKLACTNNSISLELYSHSKINLDKLISLVQNNQNGFRLSQQNNIYILKKLGDFHNTDTKLTEIKDLLTIIT